MYQVPDQSGRRIVVTGANSGTGKEATRRLAAAGAEIVMAVRTPAKGEAAKREILDSVPKARLDVQTLDLADLASVRDFADSLIGDGRGLDVLVNNAGVMTPPNREVTKDGFELQLGSNFLGPFALTNLLLPMLLKSREPRVATMTSSAADMGRMNWNDLNSQQRYSKWGAYSQSKLGNTLMGLHLVTLAERHGWNLLSTLAHPGYTRTNLQTSGASLGGGPKSATLLVRLLPSMDVVQGSEPLLHAIAEPDARQGIYYGPKWYLVGDTHEARIPAAAKKHDAARIWEIAERMTGVVTPRMAS